MSTLKLSRPPLVLIANAQEWSARSVESVLGSNGFAVLRAFTAQQALEYAQSARPDAIIADADLTDLSGYQLCRRLRADGLVGADTPIILTTTGVPSEADTLRALEAGAWELLGLPLKYEMLLLKLRAFVQARMEAERVREGGLVDEDSGFYNSKGMLRRAREMALDAARHGMPVACVVFSAEPEDPEQPGEAVRELSPEMMEKILALFRSVTRESDAVGRINPQEFVVLAPHTDSTGAIRMAERITRTASSAPIVDDMQIRLRVRAGAYGVDDFRREEMDPVELLVRATRALRRSQADPGAPPIQFYNGTPE